MTTHKTMDELAQGIRAYVEAEARGQCVEETLHHIRTHTDVPLEAAITYLREHFGMVRVRRNMARHTCVYLPGDRNYDAHESNPALGWDYFLIPKPEPPERDAVPEAMRHAAFEAKELLDGLIARGLFDERAAINRVRSQLGAALKGDSR